MEAKRHTCIVCKSKRATYKMKRFRSNWACIECLVPADDPGRSRPGGAGIRGNVVQGNHCPEGTDVRGIKALNLYAGIGGNRKLWPRHVRVTAVEHNAKVAAEYKRMYPEDEVIVGDAHSYLLKNFYKFDFIWSSSPCQTHTRLNHSFREYQKKYVDMNLYQHILLLRKFFKGRYVIENVMPYYESLISPDYSIGRHCFWANFKINNVEVPVTKGFVQMSVDDLSAWLGIKLEKRIYLNGHSVEQVYRNCVHPLIGQSVLIDAINSL